MEIDPSGEDDCPGKKSFTQFGKGNPKNDWPESTQGPSETTSQVAGPMDPALSASLPTGVTRKGRGGDALDPSRETAAERPGPVGKRSHWKKKTKRRPARQSGAANLRTHASAFHHWVPPHEETTTTQMEGGVGLFGFDEKKPPPTETLDDLLAHTADLQTSSAGVFVPVGSDSPAEKLSEDVSGDEEEIDWSASDSHESSDSADLDALSQLVDKAEVLLGQARRGPPHIKGPEQAP